mgnify:CR=1 FL=1
MKLLNTYKNGNYKVVLFDDGTKIRQTNEDKFISSFPECIDLKITNKCDMGCKYCHEDSTIIGEHGDILDAEFINTLKPYTELALGGGNVLCHPDLIEFLKILKSKNIIVNITINQIHFGIYKELIQYILDNELIKGLGISLTKSPDEEFISEIKKYSNIVIHVINGVIQLADLRKLYNQGLKLLILGYKQFRRGENYFSSDIIINKQIIYHNIEEINKGFKVVSFDNLAIKQLELRRLFSDKEWQEFYMGDDGQFTMYIDLVKRHFAKNSISVNRYDLLDNIEDMFQKVKEE